MCLNFLPLHKEVKLVSQRIKQWFNNNSRAATPSQGRKALFNLNAKPRKKLPAFQAYQKLYDEKIKSVVQREWPIEWKNSPSFSEDQKVPPPSIAFQNKIATKLLAEESEEIKQEVEKYRESRGEYVEDVDDETGDEEKERVAKAKAFQRCASFFRAHMPYLLTMPALQGLWTPCRARCLPRWSRPGFKQGASVHSSLRARSRLMEAISVPCRQSLSFVWYHHFSYPGSVHHGVNALGHNFEMWYGKDKWMEAVETPFLEFASKIFSMF